jgi:hypothetical protein
MQADNSVSIAKTAGVCSPATYVGWHLFDEHASATCTFLLLLLLLSLLQLHYIQRKLHNMLHSTRSGPIDS